MAYVDWRLSGPAVDLCNCDYGCPCQFNAPPTRGCCEAAVGFHITEGHFGDTRLDDLHVACVFAWPGAIHEGHGQAQAFIDERATEAQRQALLMLLTGQEQEPTCFFAIFASTVETMHEPRFLPVRVESDRASLSARISVPGALEGSAEPIRNPMDGSVHRAKVVLPEGFEFTDTDCASATFRTEGAIPMSHSRTNAMLWTMDVGPHGLFRSGA
ncbi:MAG: DUF1326 domain-containing protein [Gammaproteobacteria bacterium]|nr:DUF1326 domain-containing protein [Gammaproteobacteria bacterium]